MSYLTTALALCILLGNAGAQFSLKPNSQTYNFKLGNFQCVVLSDGAAPFPLSAFFPDSQQEEIDQLAQFYNFAGGNVFISFNALLCETGNWLVLIDTGSLNRFVPGLAGKIFNSLDNVGVDPADIREVIISHGHIDHFSGTFSDGFEILFPNAKVWLPQADYEFYTNVSNSDVDYFDEFNFVFDGLETAGADVRLYNPGVLFEGFEAIDANGHSPGHMVIKIASNGETLYYAADTIFNEANIATSDHPAPIDMDPEKGQKFRQSFLKRMAEEDALVVAYHISFPGIGYIEAVEESYRWIPIQWQF